MRRAVAAAGLVAVSGLLGCGGQERAAGDPFERIEQEFERRPDTLQAAPRWERVTASTGDGAGEVLAEVAGGAIQWRVRWTCRSGHLRVRVVGAPSSGPAEAGGGCASRGSAEFIGTGRRRLAVEADGPWRLVVEQQVQTPLHEPAPEGAQEIRRGTIVPVERPSRGTAALLRLPTGRLVLRLEGFRTSANSDLFVWLSEARRPRTTRQALRARHRVLAPLKATAGEQNYRLPRDVTADDFESVVVWCDPIRIAYAAAPLR